MFHKEAIMWKSLHHPNVVPLVGVSKDWFGYKFAMVSEWMANGRINNFVEAHEDVNRFKLVCKSPRSLIAQGDVTSAVGRRRSGVDLSPPPGNHPWRSQGSACPAVRTPPFWLTIFARQNNILVDGSGSSRIADFGLITFNVSDAANTSSYEWGGSVYWMSPELLYPEKFGLKNFRKTRSSDCYAFGMTVYEVLSGHRPFHDHYQYTVSATILGVVAL